MSKFPGPVPPLPRSTPELQGVESLAILGLLHDAEVHAIELHSLMIMRHGHVITEGWWEPYSRDGLQLLYSLSKSFISAAMGIAVDEGKLDIDDHVVSFFSELLPEVVSDHLSAMRVRHVLAMATGHSDDTIERILTTWPDDWVRGFLAIPPEHEPGTHFTYNNGATHMLAAILLRATGEDLLDHLRPRLLEPLGIDAERWQTAPNGIRYGFSGLHLATESIARFGQLHLQRGEWNGERLLAEAWVQQATAVQVTNSEEDNPDWRLGYGYQFWRSQRGYRGDGAFGQFCLVLPEHDAVVVTTAATENMQALLDLVWAHLLPSMHPDALLPSEHSHRLAATLSALRLPPVSGAAEPAGPVDFLGATVRAPFDVDFDVGVAAAPFEAIALDRERDGWVVVIETLGQIHRLMCAADRWHTNHLHSTDPHFLTIATSGAWTSPDEFTAKLVYTDSPHALTVTWRPAAHGPEVKLEWNVTPLG